MTAKFVTSPLMSAALNLPLLMFGLFWRIENEGCEYLSSLEGILDNDIAADVGQLV